MGALAGVVTIFLALVGLIGNFTEVYLIDDDVTFAGLMLVLPAIRGRSGGGRASGRGWGAARDADLRGRGRGRGAPARRPERRSPLAVVLSDWIGDERIRAVFLNVTPQLMEFVTFGQPPLIGGVDHRRDLRRRRVSWAGSCGWLP